MTTNVPTYHAIGIGAGPANLSLAALYQGARRKGVEGAEGGLALFDRQSGPGWHEALLHPGVGMQTSWLKDLVSVVDPTHPLSFLNYLVTSGRFFALLNSQFESLPRREYQAYLKWAAERMEGLHYNVQVDEISLTADGFQVSAGGVPQAVAANLVLGVGSRPVIPANLRGLPEDAVFIADELGARLEGMAAAKDQPIAVLGGGQTGCEAVVRLIGQGFTDIRWIGRGQWFKTIDDSPLANDFYRPEHQKFLQGLTLSTRRRLIEEQRHTGDALTPGAMKAVYQANYGAMLERGAGFPARIHVGHDVTDATVDGDMIVLHCETSEQQTDIPVRYAVVAMGREKAPIPFDKALQDRIDADDRGDMIVESDYSVRWKSREGHRIYAMNRARYSHGIPDANLTLLPVRAALVLNSLFDREVYPLEDAPCTVAWG